jgi:hypothetical protein
MNRITLDQANAVITAALGKGEVDSSLLSRSTIELLGVFGLSPRREERRLGQNRATSCAAAGPGEATIPRAGTHYLTDVIGGACAGVAAAVLVRASYREGSRLDRFLTAIL